MTEDNIIKSRYICYYSTLIDYAVKLIATKCQNVNFGNNEDAYIEPTSATTELSSQF